MRILGDREHLDLSGQAAHGRQMPIMQDIDFAWALDEAAGGTLYSVLLLLGAPCYHIATPRGMSQMRTDGKHGRRLALPALPGWCSDKRKDWRDCCLSNAHSSVGARPKRRVHLRQFKLSVRKLKPAKPKSTIPRPSAHCQRPNAEANAILGAIVNQPRWILRMLQVMAYTN